MLEALWWLSLAIFVVLYYRLNSHNMITTKNLIHVHVSSTCKLNFHSIYKDCVKIGRVEINIFHIYS